MDAFTLGYLEAMLWSSVAVGDEEYDEETGNGPMLDESYSIEDLDPKFLEECIKDCDAFQEANRKDLWDAWQNGPGCSWSSLGHDFWLTRNGHGAGFWDRGLGEVGERLTKAAKVYGSVDPYVSEGRIYG